MPVYVVLYKTLAEREIIMHFSARVFRHFNGVRPLSDCA